MGLTYHPAHISRLEVEIPGAPEALCIAPKTIRDVEAIMRYCTEKSLAVQVRGGGTHSGYGEPVEPDVVLSMERMGEIDVWEPDDLTIVLGAGAAIEATEAMLAERNQTMVMPENPRQSTVGGVIAAGVSSLRRGRLYATRERVLEVTLVTGDGRVVRSGGRVVKNVTGYDLHRLVVGAFGSLGVIVSVCLKLWPTPPGKATVTVADRAAAGSVARPLAVLEIDGVVNLYLQGTEAEVESLLTRTGGSSRPGLHWPADPEGTWEWSLRVPPAMTGEAVDRLPEEWSHVAIHGVGEVRAASSSADAAPDLRDWAEGVGGRLVVTRGHPELFDPWGQPPPGLAIQERLIAEFDPARILNRGRLPGGL